ncbi:MAG: hypothetical protein EXR29_12455 [Betaproteobacteria bacterium]|nr:hypothetical protein [Betaproteobacteria bacterium]
MTTTNLRPGTKLLCAAILILGTLAGGSCAAEPSPLALTEALFLEFLDAANAVDYIDSGFVAEYEGLDLAAWDARRLDCHQALIASIEALDESKLKAPDKAALAAIRVTLADLGDPGPAVSNAPDSLACKDAGNKYLDFESLSAVLTSCYQEIGNQLKFAQGTIDRGGALGLLGDLEEPSRRKVLFDAFLPLWAALNGNDEPDSPYRRLIKLAVAKAATNGSGVEAAARAIGVSVADVERWLVQILDAWRKANPHKMIEPWDYRYAIGEANRRIAPSFPDSEIVEVDHRYYQDLGVDLGKLGVIYDIDDRADQSPLAYTDFVRRGRYVNGAWQPTIARVVGRYRSGGLSSLNELVHENGHAVHISAIRNRPAFTDWPDTLFTEAFADVSSWSVYEPAWQKKYLGTALPTAMSLRTMLGSVMLDVAWSLFEIRMLRDPAADPNAVWTDITSRYLHIKPHPEVAWWAVRVQLVDAPGYMVNYGLGAVLTAEMRERTSQAIGPFDAGNPKWYGWLSEQLLVYGSERNAKDLMQALLGRPPSPDALLKQIHRLGDLVPGRKSAADLRPGTKSEQIRRIQ